MDELHRLYQEVILDHNRHPRNCHRLDTASCQADGFNPLCGDKLTLFLSIDDDNIIQQASFIGEGCAISTASASLMTDYLKGKTIDDAHTMFDLFHRALTTHETGVDKQLGKLAVLTGVREFPTRVKCATLAWHTLRSALANKTETACTE